MLKLQSRPLTTEIAKILLFDNRHYSVFARDYGIYYFSVFADFYGTDDENAVSVTVKINSKQFTFSTDAGNLTPIEVTQLQNTCDLYRIHSNRAEIYYSTSTTARKTRIQIIDKYDWMVDFFRFHKLPINL